MTTTNRRALAVQYGDQRLEFKVVPSNSLASSVRITVDSLTGVQVLAPVNASDAEIRAAVRRRAKWIFKHYEPQGQGSIRRRAVSGEEVLYLGRRYVLKVDTGPRNRVKLKGGKLLVETTQRSPADINSAVEGWYRQHAKEYFSRRISALFSPSMDKLPSPPDFYLRKMKRQWGSCSPAGKLQLNPLQIRAPRLCVDYVIAHELCHLSHHDHSADFYQLLNARMPDWQERKAFLELVAAQILAPLSAGVSGAFSNAKPSEILENDKQ